MDDITNIRSLLSKGTLTAALEQSSKIEEKFTKLSYCIHIFNLTKSRRKEKKYLAELEKLIINSTPQQKLIHSVLSTQYIYRDYNQKETAIQIERTEKLYHNLNNNEKKEVQFWYKTFMKINAYYNHISNRFDLALRFYLEYKEISEGLNQMDSVCNAYLGIGEVYAEQGDFDKALENYNKALVLSKEIENLYEIGFALLYTGKVNEKLGYYDKAIENFEASIKSFQHSNLSQFAIIGFLNLGYIQLQLGEIDEAITNFNRVIGNGTHEYSPIHLADAFYYLGIANLSKNNFKPALEAFTKNIDICNQTNNYIKESLTLFKLITGCIRFEQTKLAISYYDRLSFIANNTSNKIINLRFKLAGGIILQNSVRIAKIVEANDIFYSIISDPEVEEFSIKMEATISLCKGLIFEFRLTNSEEVLDEINKYLDWILDSSQKQKLVILQIEGLIIKSKLLVAQMQIEDALNIIDRALELTEKTGVTRINQEIMSQRTKIFSQISKYQHNVAEENKILKKIEEATVNEYLEELQNFLNSI